MSPTVTTAGPSAGRAPLELGTEAHYRWLDGIVRSMLVLNLLDAVFTMIWVYAGLAKEANPLMRELVNGHPVLFVVIKMGLVGGCSFCLWRLRYRPLAVVAIFVAFLVYYALLIAHVGFASWFLGIMFFP